jgi:hypothetical protein
MWNNALFGVLAGCGALMAAICHWHLQTFTSKFFTIVEAARQLVG